MYIVRAKQLQKVLVSMRFRAGEDSDSSARGGFYNFFAVAPVFIFDQQKTKIRQKWQITIKNREVKTKQRELF